jgi:hypothetical protein
MKSRLLATVTLILFASYGVVADVRTEQKTQVQFAGMLGRVVNLFGGKAAREGVTSTVIVKGNRKVTTTDNISQIIDLDEEKIYDIDLRRKQYKVTTFAEVRRQMEEARKKAEEDARRETGGRDREEPAKRDEPQKEVEVDFDVKNTGQTKTINGFNTSQAVITVTVREKGKTLEESGGLVMTTDMWMTPEQKALREIAEFDLRYAQKLYGGMFGGVSASQMAMMMAMYPLLKPAMDRMQAEGGKLEGTAIQTTLTFEAVQSAEQAKAAQKEEAPSARGGVGGLLGGLAKRAARRGDDEPKTRVAFMTSNTEVLKVATDVSADEVALPAGFKETK